jgi:geranyl-CoA carboxylase alpha subunit
VRYYCDVLGRERMFSFQRTEEGLLARRDDGEEFRIDLSMIGDGTAFSLVVDGRSYDCLVERARGGVTVQVLGERILVRVQDEREKAAERVASAKGTGKRDIEAAMPGVVVTVKAAVGDVVEEGDTLIILEAMKMQNPVQADGPGKVTKILVEAGRPVAAGDVLVELDEA